MNNILSQEPKQRPHISVLIPVYNEKKTVQEIVQVVLANTVDQEIIIVDDGSTDGTREILKNKIQGKYQEVKVIFHKKNQGKGAAIRTAIKSCTGQIAIIQDADLEYDPKEYPVLLAPIIEGKADVVYGSRFLGGSHRVHLYWHSVFNKILTTLSNIMTNINLTDMETCYKVFKTDIIKNIDIKSNRFNFEPEITAKVAKAGCRIYEVPISYAGRDISEGKKIGWQDGVQALWTIFKYRFFD